MKRYIIFAFLFCFSNLAGAYQYYFNSSGYSSKVDYAMTAKGGVVWVQLSNGIKFYVDAASIGKNNVLATILSANAQNKEIFLITPVLHTNNTYQNIGDNWSYVGITSESVNLFE